MTSSYSSGQGVFASLYPDGTKVQVRGVIDFHTIATLIPQHLAPNQVDEMLRFVRTELGTSDWIRALSRHDPNANIASFRPDHGTIGSYDAWPAQVMQAQLSLGTPTAAADALAVIERIEPTTYEGPFGQARTLIQDNDGGGGNVGGDGGSTAAAASVSAGAHSAALNVCNYTYAGECRSLRSYDYLMQFYNAASGPFANTVIAGFFGFAGASWETLLHAPARNRYGSKHASGRKTGNGNQGVGFELLNPSLDRGFTGAMHNLYECVSF